MSEEGDGGIDKQNILSEISSVPLPPAPAEIPPALPPPDPIALPSVAFPARASQSSRRRHRMAAIVASLVALIWLVVGVWVQAWVPGLIGIAFGAGAIAIWALEVWDGD